MKSNQHERLQRREEQSNTHRQTYAEGRQSFIADLLPEEALQWPIQETLSVLTQRLGATKLTAALDPEQTIPSPLYNQTDTRWIRRANIVGVNVRTVGHFWNVVKYALTLPAAQDSIHLLPIWEPGVVASLYGMTSWNINLEFFSTELAIAHPRLDTVDKQLKAVVNLLHAMGKTVGMDVIPHTDRYSEIVLANPHYFEWLQRRGDQITDHRADLHRAVQTFIFLYLQERGSAGAQPLPEKEEAFFSTDFPEAQRLAILFGAPEDYQGRLQRRDDLIQALYQAGYEPAPAAMGPPYRGLRVDPDENNAIVDRRGRVWRDYLITNPQEMSRVFGPLTRYKLYERLDDNQHWAVDFDRPRPEVWDYVCRKYAEVQAAYNLDFMRGDMSHVQMRPAGVPTEAGPYYDIHRAVKNHIREQVPYFAYYAESFLAAPGYMAYGDEVDHLELSHAEVALGNLQSMVVGSPRFLQNFRWYLDIAQTRSLTPCWTIMTGDKDDPRFDEFYLHGNEARFFIGLFLTDLPSYMALGFECRDPHPQPAPNEHYTKLYVFRIDEGAKATHGPYRWGQNYALFERLQSIRRLAEEILPEIHRADTHWLLPPDPTGGQPVIAWTQAGSPQWLFVVNLHPTEERTNVKIPLPRPLAVAAAVQLQFSTHRQIPTETILQPSRNWIPIEKIAPGEGLTLSITTTP